MIKNPIFIPKNLRKTDKEGIEARYLEKQIGERRVRIIEYRDRSGLLVRANIWGICGELRELEDCFVAYDKSFDTGVIREIRESVEEMYPKPINVTFF